MGPAQPEDNPLGGALHTTGVHVPCLLVVVPICIHHAPGISGDCWLQRAGLSEFSPTAVGGGGGPVVFASALSGVTGNARLVVGRDRIAAHMCGCPILKNAHSNGT